MRRKRSIRALLRAMAAGSDRFGFRLVQYSVQSNHLHLIVEGRDRRAVSRGMQGLLIRCAKGLNKVWGRKGSVFSDRYHDRILRSPREVRNALAYVLHNWRRHGIYQAGNDPFSSGRWFDGWREGKDPLGEETRPPLAQARTWLLNVGWRRHGLIPLSLIPGD